VGIGPSQDPLDIHRRSIPDRRTRRPRSAPARRSRGPGTHAHDLVPGHLPTNSMALLCRTQRALANLARPRPASHRLRPPTPVQARLGRGFPSNQPKRQNRSSRPPREGPAFRTRLSQCARRRVRRSPRQPRHASAQQGVWQRFVTKRAIRS
jgi:hypothetical protein